MKQIVLEGHFAGEQSMLACTAVLEGHQRSRSSTEVNKLEGNAQSEELTTKLQLLTEGKEGHTCRLADTLATLSKRKLQSVAT